MDSSLDGHTGTRQRPIHPTLKADPAISKKFSAVMLSHVISLEATTHVQASTVNQVMQCQSTLGVANRDPALAARSLFSASGPKRISHGHLHSRSVGA
jgi:hypothetical protein